MATGGEDAGAEQGREVRAGTGERWGASRMGGWVLCQGKRAAERWARRMRADSGNRGHPMTEERRARLTGAARHPDEADFALARETFRAILARGAGSFMATQAGGMP